MKKTLQLRDRSGRVHQIGSGRSPFQKTKPAQPAEPSHRKGSRPPRKENDRHERTESRQAPRFERRGEKTEHYRGGRSSRPQRSLEPGRAKAIVDKNHKGFAFLSFEDRRREDAFLPPRDAEQVFHGDRVEVVIDRAGRIVELNVLEHRFRELVGRFYKPPGDVGKKGWVIYERKKSREEVLILRPPANVKPGDWVRAKLDFSGKSGLGVTGEITEHFGEILPATADIAMVAAEFNLLEEHPEDAVKEAQAFRLEADRVLSDGHREDLRHIPFITIDGETARDFDDAVFVERARNGGFTLWVAIADVSHYVTPGTALDRDARSRGTSVYFPERAFHMLPRALSENLCSLRPNEPRLAFVARIEFDASGRRGKVELLEALIESRRRATYTEIQREFETEGKNPQWQYKPHFDLFAKLKKGRHSRGSIDFDLPEARIQVDSEGNPVAIVRQERYDAHRLIEEFMIAANEAVTAWAMDRDWPFVYRIHDEPAEVSIKKFQDLAAHFGLKLVIKNERNLPQLLGNLITQLEGHPAQQLLNMALLRSMKQAIYSATHGRHFGLASEGYTHFTSPIRRYPDLVVHRVLRHALRVEKKKTKRPSGGDFDKIERELQDIAEHCSYRERIAAEADREAIKLKQVRFAMTRLGSEFEGKVNGLIGTGMFVQLNEPYLEGLVPLDTLPGDFFRFDEEKMRAVGQRTRQVIQIGDAVKVRVARADLDSRQIDFALVEFLTKRTASPAELKTPKHRHGPSRPHRHPEKKTERPAKRKRRR